MVLADQYFQKTGDLGWDLRVESEVIDRVSAVATELVSRASGEAIWRFNGEWEIGSVEGVGDGCQVGKGWKFAGGSWGNLSRGIRGKREDFAGTRLGSSRRDSRARREAEVFRVVAGAQWTWMRAERRADGFFFWDLLEGKGVDRWVETRGRLGGVGRMSLMGLE